MDKEAQTELCKTAQNEVQEIISVPIDTSPKFGRFTSPSVEGVQLLADQYLAYGQPLNYYRLKRSGFFNPNADYPIPALLHALQHDIATFGRYSSDNQHKLDCSVEPRFCLVPPPSEFVADLLKLQKSPLAKKANILWADVKSDSKDIALNDRKFPSVSASRGPNYFELKISHLAPEITLRMFLSQLQTETVIKTIEPTNEFGAIFDSSTTISFPFTSPIDQHKFTFQTALNAPNLPAVAATILSIVKGQVWL